MQLSDAGVDFIVSFEGKLKSIGDGKYTAYKCPAGVWTIYAGCTEGVTPGMVVTEDEGRQMFRRELVKHEDAVAKLVKVPLTQCQYDALVSFSYNCGAGALARSTLLKHLNAGDYALAASRFGDYKSGGGKVLPGLVRRRAAEAALFMKDDPSPMPQKVDAAKPISRSGTIWGAVAALSAGVVQYTETTVATGFDVIAQMTAWEPLKSSLLQTGANAKAIGLGVCVAAVVLVIARRTKAHVEGKIG